MAIPADAKAYGQKYTNTKARDVQYQDEFTKGSKHVAETLIELAKRGKSTAASKHLFKTQFCWSAEDVERYFAVSTDLSTGKESIEVTSPVQRLDDKEREKYELKVKAGKFFQGDMTEPYDTSGARSKFMGAGFAIFVMAPDGRIYAGQHKVGLFHHSSFLSGGDVAGAGEIKVDKGRLTYLTNKSGHYLPEKEQVMQVLEELRSRGVSLAGVDYTHLDARNWAATNKFPGGAEGFLRVGRAHMAVPA